jgi:hypothetical protein
MSIDKLSEKLTSQQLEEIIRLQTAYVSNESLKDIKPAIEIKCENFCYSDCFSGKNLDMTTKKELETTYTFLQRSGIFLSLNKVVFYKLGEPIACLTRNNFKGLSLKIDLDSLRKT